MCSRLSDQSVLNSGVPSAEGLCCCSSRAGGDKWPADVSPAVAAAQGTAVGSNEMIWAAFPFGFNAETIFSLENSSGSLVFQGCLREFHHD